MLRTGRCYLWRFVMFSFRVGAGRLVDQRRQKAMDRLPPDKLLLHVPSFFCQPSQDLTRIVEVSTGFRRTRHRSIASNRDRCRGVFFVRSDNFRVMTGPRNMGETGSSLEAPAVFQLLVDPWGKVIRCDLFLLPLVDYQKR